MDRKVLIQNQSNCTVSLINPNLRLRTVWNKRGDKRMVSLEALSEALYETGTKALFDRGYLYVVNKEDRIALGLEEEEETMAPSKILTDEERNYFLTTAPVNELKELLPTLSEVQVQLLIDYAVDNKLATVSRNDVIKRFCGKDIIKLTELKRLKEED